jgi:hypothetical protein
VGAAGAPPAPPRALAWSRDGGWPQRGPQRPAGPPAHESARLALTRAPAYHSAARAGALTPQAWTDRLLTPPAPNNSSGTPDGNDTLILWGGGAGGAAPLVTEAQARRAAAAGALDLVGPAAAPALRAALRAAADGAPAAATDMPADAGADAPPLPPLEPRAFCGRGGGACGLAYTVPLRLPPLGGAPPLHLDVLVAAGSGAVLGAADALRSAAPAAPPAPQKPPSPDAVKLWPATGRGGTLWKLNKRGRVRLGSARTGAARNSLGAFKLQDPRRFGAATLDYGNNAGSDAAGDTRGAAKVFQDGDNRWWALRPPAGGGGGAARRSAAPAAAARLRIACPTS